MDESSKENSNTNFFHKTILLENIRYNTNKINISNDTKQEKDTYTARL